MKYKLLLLLALSLFILLAGCTPQEAAPVDLMKTYQQIEAAVNLPPMLAVDSELAMEFYGIDTAGCAQWSLHLAEDSLIADEILLLEAKDKAGADAIEKLLKSRMDAKAAEAITYSPEQYAIIQKGHLLRQGLHLALIVSPDADAILSVYQAAFQPGQ